MEMRYLQTTLHQIIYYIPMADLMYQALQRKDVMKHGRNACAD